MYAFMLTLVLAAIALAVFLHRRAVQEARNEGFAHGIQHGLREGRREGYAQGADDKCIELGARHDRELKDYGEKMRILGWNSCINAYTTAEAAQEEVLYLPQTNTPKPITA